MASEEHHLNLTPDVHIHVYTHEHTHTYKYTHTYRQRGGHSNFMTLALKMCVLESEEESYLAGQENGRQYAVTPRGSLQPLTRVQTLTQSNISPRNVVWPVTFLARKGMGCSQQLSPPCHPSQVLLSLGIELKERIPAQKSSVW